MRYVIQYYAPAVAKLPEMECVETNFGSLSEVEAQAQRAVRPGGAYEWAEAYEIMDHDLVAGDPAVASWSRHRTGGSHSCNPTALAA